MTSAVLVLGFMFCVFVTNGYISCELATSKDTWQQMLLGLNVLVCLWTFWFGLYFVRMLVAAA